MAIFCHSLISCFLGMSLSDCEMVSVAQIITGIILISHFICTEFLFYSLYILESSQRLFDNNSLSRNCSIFLHVPSSFSRVMMFRLFGMILLVCTT